MWLVFNQPEARALYSRHYNATKSRDSNTSAVLHVACFSVCSVGV